MSCSNEDDHPVYTNGKDIEAFAANGELLYRRYKKEHYQEKRLLPAAFQFPKQSVNRQKFSNPEDVLHVDCCNGKRFEGWGVLEISSADMPTPLESPDGKLFHFIPEHEPLVCCYAHSVIRVKSGESNTFVDAPSTKVKETFRVQLALKMKVRIAATA